MKLLFVLALIFVVGCDTVKYTEDLPVSNEDEFSVEDDFSVVDSGGVSGLRSRAVSIPGTWHQIPGLKACDIGTHPTENEIAISYRSVFRRSGLATYSFTQNSTNLTKLYHGLTRGNPAHGVAMDRNGVAWGVQYGINTSVHTNILRLHRVDINLLEVNACYKENPYSHKKSPGYNAIDIGIGGGTMTHTGNDLFNLGIIIMSEGGNAMYKIKSPFVNADFCYDKIYEFTPGEFLGSRVAVSNTNYEWDRAVIIDSKRVYRYHNSHYNNYTQFYDGIKSQDVSIEPIRFLNKRPATWMIGTDTGGYGGRIYMWNSSTGDWDEAGGRASRVAVDQHGRPWIVNKIGDVFCWY